MQRVLLAGLLVLLAPLGVRGDEQPPMKFNEVREIAPGVFFRYSSISPTDPSIFGGCNNIWVVFEDYVVVIDANFPKEADDVLAAIRKTTSKPVRYVFDTHHHGDHAYGNAVWVKAGASIVAHRKCMEILRTNGPKEFEDAGRPPNGRKDVAGSVLKVPTVTFDDKLVLDDGKQRVEFLFLGHAHTPGDGVAWLPRQQILCTGDACVNGAYNFMGHSDSASWIRALERMQGLDVKIVCPGHGLVVGKELLERQKRYFVEMRAAVRQGIDAGKELPDIIKGFKPAWYKEWTTVDPSIFNVTHVYDELTGRIAPADLGDYFDLGEGPSPTKKSPGWKAPKRIVIPAGLTPSLVEELKRIAPKVEFVPAKSPEAAAKEAAGADAVLGFVTAEVIGAGGQLRWVQVGREGLTPEARAALAKGGVVLTNVPRATSRQQADQVMELLRQLRSAGTSTRGDVLSGLRRQTMLVVGQGSTGTQVARRAHALGMTVWAVDEAAGSKPEFVDRLGRLEELAGWLPRADVVVVACRPTTATRGLLGSKELKPLPKGALFIDVTAGKVTVPAALADFLKERPGSVGLGAVWREGADEATWSKAGALIAEQPAPSPERQESGWRLFRENVRRFVAGEKLLGVVEK
jgi:phosphoglycerate dehydrogenase-like enzyme/glyoxylase-like metal-dependent hydrolase (beta-lactamase superfamily II)